MKEIVSENVFVYGAELFWSWSSWVMTRIFQAVNKINFCWFRLRQWPHFQIHFKPALRKVQACLIINNQIKLTPSRLKNRTLYFRHFFGRFVYFGRRPLVKCTMGLSYASCVFCEELYTACKFIKGSITLKGTMARFCFDVEKGCQIISEFYLWISSYTKFHRTRNYPKPTP